MKKLIALGLIIALYSASAFAQAASTESFALSWTIPTTRVNGAPLAVTEIASYNIYYSVDNAAEVITNVTPNTAMAKTITMSLPVRSTPYAVAFSMDAVDITGLKGPRSSLVVNNVTVVNATPSAPTGLTVTITCVAGSCSVLVK